MGIHHLARRRWYLGWLASLIMRTDVNKASCSISSSASSAQSLPACMLGKGNINSGMTVETFLWSLLGAMILLAIVN